MNALSLAGGILAGLILVAGAAKAVPTVGRCVLGVGQFIVAAGQAPLIIRQVAAEFAPNHGGSLRDAVDRMELRFDEHAEQDRKNFDEIHSALVTLAEKTAAL